MDDGSKKTEYNCKYVPSIMVLTYIETEKYHKSVKHHKYALQPYLDDATEMTLPICKCLLMFISVANTGTEIA